jgi:POT family proton-dependent oligopeptide transporter
MYEGENLARASSSQRQLRRLASSSAEAALKRASASRVGAGAAEAVDAVPVPGPGAPQQAGEEEVFDNVQCEEDLARVPAEFLSGDAKRPLLSRDEADNTYTHVLKPLFYSVCFILLVELLERLAYYGVVFTQLSYLSGHYDPAWSANMTSVEASAFVGSSVAITYTMPFVGAIVADSLLGNFWTILLFSLVFYLPGLLMIALSSVPGLVSATFPMTMVTWAMLGFYPMGAGAIKACVNVMGAQQYHPVLQKAQIERFYVNFYLAYVLDRGATNRAAGRVGRGGCSLLLRDQLFVCRSPNPSPRSIYFYAGSTSARS